MPSSILWEDTEAMLNWCEEPGVQAGFSTALLTNEAKAFCPDCDSSVGILGSTDL